MNWLRLFTVIMGISSDNYNIDRWINRFHGKLSPNSDDLTDFTVNPGNFTQFTDVRGIFTENDGNFAGILSTMAGSWPDFTMNSDQLTQFVNVPTIFTRQDRAFKRYQWSQHEIRATITMMAEHFVMAEDLCDHMLQSFSNHTNFFTFFTVNDCSLKVEAKLRANNSFTSNNHSDTSTQHMTTWQWYWQTLC